MRGGIPRDTCSDPNEGRTGDGARFMKGQGGERGGVLTGRSRVLGWLAGGVIEADESDSRR